MPTANLKKGCSSCAGALLLVLVSVFPVDVNVEVCGMGVVDFDVEVSTGITEEDDCGVGIVDVDTTHVDVDHCGLGIEDVEKTFGDVDVGDCVVGIWLVEFGIAQSSGATKNARLSKFSLLTNAAS